LCDGFCRSTVSNSTKETTCYSDFLVPGDFPNYMPHSKYLEYFRKYADHFHLQQHIRFGTEVMSLEQLSDDWGRWSVTTKKTKDSTDATTSELFDAVMVCIGIGNAVMPTYDGQNEFKGQLMHSIHYK